MSKTHSFALALLLLFAMLIATAWGVARFERGSWDAPSTIFISDTRICHFMPGHELAYPTAVEIAEARAYGNLCPYDPPQGVRLLPSSGELDQARHAASAARSDDRAIGDIVPLPSTDGGWLIGAGIAAAAGVGLLVLRYLRRTAAAASAVLETTHSAPASRGWLTRRRVAAVGAGWLMTVGVLAAAYPMISALIPHQQHLSGDPAPAATPGATTTTPYDPAEDAAAADTRAASATAATDFILPPPAPSGSNGGADSIDSSGAAPASLSFSVPGAAGGAAGGKASNGGASDTAAVPDASAATQSLGHVTTSLAALSTYLPASNPVTDAGDSGASAGTSPATDSGASAGTPAASPAGTTTTGDTSPTPGIPAATPAPVTPVAGDGQNPLATVPVIDPANPLPSGPDAVIPAPTDGDGGATVPANPASLDDGDDGATAVPEPAMLGLFGMGALLVLRRRRGK